MNYFHNLLPHSLREPHPYDVFAHSKSQAYAWHGTYIFGCLPLMDVTVPPQPWLAVPNFVWGSSTLSPRVSLATLTIFLYNFPSCNMLLDCLGQCCVTLLGTLQSWFGYGAYLLADGIPELLRHGVPHAD